MRMLSLFAGIGGIDLAAHWAGIETVAFCEIEPYCQKVLQKNWPGVPIFDDVRTINKQQLIEKGVIGDERSIDIICGGYPCQPFSNAGQRLGEEDDRHLWPEMLRLIKELRPTWVLGENVDGHVTLGLDTVLADLDEAGYTARAFVIPAAAVYAPHQRKRVFVVGHTERGGCGGESWGRTGTITQNRYSQLEEGDVAYSKSIDSGRLSIRACASKPGFACSSQDVANTQGERCGETWELRRNERTERITGSGKTLANSSSTGREEFSLATFTDGSGHGSRRSNERRTPRATESRMGGNLDGLSDWLDRFRWPAAMGLDQYDWEPSRVITGMKGKVREARLKSLGNAVNPVQVLPIIWGIKQIDDQAI
ncbi:DNA cytosine methyltransferase [Brevibacillus parabrevis]|jgi:DNA-methyltransferase (dcm)|uniref:DNA cytosine methyltransferase n=1 Tax=Brevibacillus parabrevis TaxID=54914 RepID=UPI0024905BB6|nr:DNA (cytosine-5-)-methyltransferase [Brevibacillus parabrevis]